MRVQGQLNLDCTRTQRKLPLLNDLQSLLPARSIPRHPPSAGSKRRVSLFAKIWGT